MHLNGRPLKKLPSKGRALIFGMKDGRTVRFRTCNDHVLIVLANSPSPDAELNIEGTDYLLIVLAKKPRTAGPVIVFLVPTGIAVEAARTGHRSWLSGRPVSNSANTPWNIWFDSEETDLSHGFINKWEEFRLEANVSTVDFMDSKSNTQPESTVQPIEVVANSSTTSEEVNVGIRKNLRSSENLRRESSESGDSASVTQEKLGDVILRAKREIAAAAGVDPSSVRISVDLG